MTNQEDKKGDEVNQTYIPLGELVLEVDALKGHFKTVHGSGEILKTLDGKFVRVIIMGEVSREEAIRYRPTTPKGITPLPIELVYQKRKSGPLQTHEYRPTYLGGTHETIQDPLKPHNL